MSTLWKLCLFYGNYVCLIHFYGNLMEIICRRDLPSGQASRTGRSGRCLLGSVGVGRGAGALAGPISAQELERSEFWKLCSDFMENFHGQTCTGSIMEISCT